jgi:hypothetical protein
MLGAGRRIALDTTRFTRYLSAAPVRPDEATADRWFRRMERLDRLAFARARDDADDLRTFEGSRWSQNGEDGVIAEIVRRVGAPSRTFVEIAAGDGGENCTRALLDDGWKGVWIEGDAHKVAAARALVDERPCTVVQLRVDRENVNSVFAEHAPCPDVVVFDVDGNDWWLWERVGRSVRPRIVVAEYNAMAGPTSHWVMPYDPEHRWRHDARYGAGLGALACLGARLGYSLIACESTGTNAFFVRADLVDAFPAHRLRRLYRPPTFGSPWGHPPRPDDTPAGVTLSSAEACAVTLSALDPPPAVAAPLEPLYLRVRLSNGSAVAISSGGDHPIRLAVEWVPDGEAPDIHRRTRTMQAWRADPGGSAVHLLRAIAPSAPGGYTLVVTIVQEGVRWFDDVPSLMIRHELVVADTGA